MIGEWWKVRHKQGLRIRSPRPDHEEAVTIGLEKERCSGSFHLAVRFLAVDLDGEGNRHNGSNLSRNYATLGPLMLVQRHGDDEERFTAEPRMRKRITINPPSIC